MELQNGSLVFQFPCNYSSNVTIDRKLSHFVPLATIAKCLIAFLGIITNGTALIIFYRINWFRRNQMITFIVGTVTNLLACCSLFGSATVLTIGHLYEHYIWKQLTCVGIMVPAIATLTLSQKVLLLMALDRILAHWMSFQWFRMKLIYKWVPVVFLFVYCVLQESLWLAFVDEDTCVLSCFFGYVNYPKTWWLKFVTVSDSAFNFLTVVMFFMVPVSTVCHGKSFVRQMKSECFIIYDMNIFLKDRQTLARMRLLSFIYVSGFLCTMLIGAVTHQYTQNVLFNLNHKLLYIVIAANCLMFVHLVFSPLVFIIDASFRWDLRRFCRSLFQYK